MCDCCTINSYFGLTNGIGGAIIGGSFFYLLTNDSLVRPTEWLVLVVTIIGCLLDFGSIALLLIGSKRRWGFRRLYQSYLVYAILDAIVLSLQFGCLMVMLGNHFAQKQIGIRVYMSLCYILLTLIEFKIINCLIYFVIFGYQRMRRESNYFKV